MQDKGSVWTLVSPEVDAGGLKTALDAGRGRLASAGAEDLEDTWLEPGRAHDMSFSGLTVQDAKGLLQGVPELEGLDWAVQDGANRERRLLVADMESTVIANEMLDELAEAVGCQAEMVAITVRAMNDEIDFEEALQQRVRMLAGLAVQELDRAAERIVVDAGAAVLLATLRRRGVRAVLATGGFTYFAEPIAQRLGFDACSANRLEIRDGKLTGAVIPPVLNRQSKVQALLQHCDELGIAPRQAVAVGDGANDLAMLARAGLGVAFHGKPRVVAEAPHNIRYGKLDTLLFYMGMRRSDWAAV